MRAAYASSLDMDKWNNFPLMAQDGGSFFGTFCAFFWKKGKEVFKFIFYYENLDTFTSRARPVNGSMEKINIQIWTLFNGSNGARPVKGFIGPIEKYKNIPHIAQKNIQI